MPEGPYEDRIATLLARPYLKLLRGDAKEGFLASAPELPGCITAGETEEQALLLLKEAMAGWFETALVHGWEIPEPASQPLGHRIL
jgi:predicted RNase H-like HicB family nuclease